MQNDRHSSDIVTQSLTCRHPPPAVFSAAGESLGQQCGCSEEAWPPSVAEQQQWSWTPGLCSREGGSSLVGYFVSPVPKGQEGSPRSTRLAKSPLRSQFQQPEAQ